MAIEMREPVFRAGDCVMNEDAGYGTIVTVVSLADEGTSTLPGYYVDFGDGEHVWMFEHQLDRVGGEQCATGGAG
jgi:hypothetical protein